MKKVLAIAIVLIGTCITVSAQENISDSNVQKTEQVQKKAIKHKKDRKNNHKRNFKNGTLKQDTTKHNRFRGQDRQHVDLFKGIELNDNQKQAIKEMRETEKANLKKERKEEQKARKEAQVQKQAQRDEQIKNILTAEQYEQYQKNVAELKALKEVNRDSLNSKKHERRFNDNNGKKRMARKDDRLKTVD